MSAEQTVMLTEAAPTIALEPGQAATGTLRISLTWEPEPGRRKGLLGRLLRRNPVHLDLGCLYEYADGSKGVVQALGETFDDLHTFGAEPILWLDGVQRSGPESGGENLFVDLEYRGVIRRLLVFVFSYEGVPDWAAADPRITLHPAAGPRIEVPLSDPDSSSPLVAAALLDRAGEGVAVHREVRWVRGGQQKLDELYDWGMQWRSTRGDSA